MKQNLTEKHHCIEKLSRIQLASVLRVIIFLTTRRLENSEEAFNVKFVAYHLTFYREAKELLKIHTSILVAFGLIEL